MFKVGDVVHYKHDKNDLYEVVSEKEYREAGHVSGIAGCLYLKRLSGHNSNYYWGRPEDNVLARKVLFEERL